MYEYAKVKKKCCLMMTGFRAETYLPIKSTLLNLFGGGH
jgi:hypothetical protein